MIDTGYPSTPSPRTDVAAASSPSSSSSAQVCSFSSFRSGALLLPSRGHRRRGDPACSPPSRARYGVRLPRRVVQWTSFSPRMTIAVVGIPPVPLLPALGTASASPVMSSNGRLQTPRRRQMAPGERRMTFRLGDADAQEIPAPRRFGVALMSPRRCLKNIGCGTYIVSFKAHIDPSALG
jgi:hypothetical protein